MPRRATTTLTDTAIRKLRPKERRYEVRDAARPGFGVRVEPDGRKIFFQRFGVHGERRLTLGGYSEAFGLSQAYLFTALKQPLPEPSFLAARR